MIRPGDLVGSQDREMAAESLAAESGLGRDAILSPRFGYPPIPVPPSGGRRGEGRLPAGLEPAMARHPVFWLERPTRLRRRGEVDETFALRLYLELAARGYVDAVTGRWRDALWTVGIDAQPWPDSGGARRRPAGHQRVASYRDGGRDEALEALVIPLGPSESLPEGWAATEARRLIRVLAKSDAPAVEEYERTAPLAAESAFESIHSVDPRRFVGRFREAVGTGSRRDAQAALVEALVVVDSMWDDLEVVWEVARPPGLRRPNPAVAGARPSWAENPESLAETVAAEACSGEAALQEATGFLVAQFDRVRLEADRVAELVASRRDASPPTVPITMFTRRPIAAPEWLARVATAGAAPQRTGGSGARR